MVAATKERSGRRQKKTAVIDVPVEFGGVSIGEATARLGVRISRDHIELATADECFCGHRLTGNVQLGGADDAQGQKKLVDDMQHSVSGAFDCKRIGVSSGQISIGLTFSLADVDISELAKFSKGTGRMIVEDVLEIPESSSGSSGDDSDEDDDE